jgi:6-pyruvoyltetrahydropterin/6-carboxytetrahydropterin synthase
VEGPKISVATPASSRHFFVLAAKMAALPLTAQREGGKGQMVYLTRRVEFSASHYFHNPEMTPEENQRVFGRCNNPHGHGHNYTLDVTVMGEVDPRTGMVLDLKDLKKILEAEVLRLMDHRFLNKEVPAFAHKIPTTENMAIEIWNLLASKLPGTKLHRIRLYESTDLYVDYYGE